MVDRDTFNFGREKDTQTRYLELLNLWGDRMTVCR